MSAETLRRAAAVARDEWAGEESGPFKNAARIHLAVADWLEQHATQVEVMTDSGRDWRPDPGALTVARAYLGEA